MENPQENLVEKLKELGVQLSDEDLAQAIDYCVLSEDNTVQGKIERPIVRFADDVFYGVTPEGVQLGEKNPEFFLRFPYQSLENVHAVMPFGRGSGRRYETPLGEIPKLNMADLARLSVINKLKGFEKKSEISGPASRHLVDFNPVLEDGTFMLLLQPKRNKQEDDGFGTVKDLKHFILTHKERMDDFFGYQTQDYVRIPKQSNIDELVEEHYRQRFNAEHVDLIHSSRPENREQLVRLYNADHQAHAEEIHKKALKLLKDGTIFTADTYDEAKKARERFVKAIAWIQKATISLTKI